MALTGEIAAHFERQAKACAALGSPFTARICRLLSRLLDETSATGRRILGWSGDPAADALALRICGGLHRLVIEGRDPALAAAYPPNDVDDDALAEMLAGALHDHDGALSENLDSAPQTNEIARSAMLLPGLLAIARETRLPLSLCEIGSSGGLNLSFDRFFYRYGDLTWGDQASPVRIEPELRSAKLPLEGDLDVLSRHGCDIAPVDVSTPEGRLRLRSYVWPDQTARLQRLDGAIALARQHPFLLEKADASAFLRRRLAARPANAAFVLLHSIMWQYLPHDTQASIIAALDEAGASTAAPVAWLRMEPLDQKDSFATLSLTSWPGGERRHLARCDYHGRWIEWTE
jgi:hypothetical protein